MTPAALRVVNGSGCSCCVISFHIPALRLITVDNLLPAHAKKQSTSTHLCMLELSVRCSAFRRALSSVLRWKMQSPMTSRIDLYGVIRGGTSFSVDHKSSHQMTDRRSWG